MKVKQLLDRRAGYSLLSLGLLLGLAAPAVVPAFASAATLSTRSIVMSTSATGATAQYDIKFTAPTTIAVGGGVAIEFCSNTAVTGDTCTRPAGMDTNPGATLVDVKTNNVSMTDDGTLDKDGPDDEEGSLLWTAAESHTGGNTLELIISGITNPTSVGVFYARVMTFANGTQLSAYTGEETGEFGAYADEGSMALAATAGIGVTSYVLEAMSFCVSRGDVGDDNNATAIGAQAAPSENCGVGESGDCDPIEVDADAADDGCVVAPTMTLGTDDGSGRIALATSRMALGKVWAQLSSNASGNTVVNLKSDAADCGGLYLNGNKDAEHCFIAPQDTEAATFNIGDAKFGLTVGSAVGALKANGDPTSGSGTINTSGDYSDSDYYINFVTNNTSGVTSTYGDPIFTTDGAVDNMNVPVTFGASISSNTPAGTYGANLSLIAVGTF